MIVCKNNVNIYAYEWENFQQNFMKFVIKYITLSI